MFNIKEIKIFSIVCLVIELSLIVAGALFGAEPLYIFVAAMFILSTYITGTILFYILYRRLERIRNATDVMDKDMPEKYIEGEIGRLAESISATLTKLSEAEDKQRREKEFLRDIISDISHQIKTPVASLTVFNDILLDAIEDEDLCKMLMQSEQQLERIRWLIESMLQLARIEAESVTFINKPTGIRGIIESCVSIVSGRAFEKNVTFAINGDDVSIPIDAEWFQEALINVVKNAVDYSPDNSVVSVDISHTPIATRISVTDSGIGIKESDRLNIFKRFYRANDNSVNPNSVGIGLALSKSIIEGCGGRIWVESRHISECVGDEKSYTRMIIMF